MKKKYLLYASTALVSLTAFTYLLASRNFSNVISAKAGGRTNSIELSIAKNATSSGTYDSYYGLYKCSFAEENAFEDAAGIKYNFTTDAFDVDYSGTYLYGDELETNPFASVSDLMSIYASGCNYGLNVQFRIKGAELNETDSYVGYDTSDAGHQTSKTFELNDIEDDYYVYSTYINFNFPKGGRTVTLDKIMLYLNCE